MATHAYISMKNEDGTYSAIYCHNDGDIAHVGAMLEERYRDPDDVQELIDDGPLSALDENSFHNVHAFSRQSDDVLNNVTWNELVKASKWIDLTYIYDPEIRDWKYMKWGDEDLRDLRVDLGLSYGIDPEDEEEPAVDADGTYEGDVLKNTSEYSSAEDDE